MVKLCFFAFLFAPSLTINAVWHRSPWGLYVFSRFFFSTSPRYTRHFASMLVRLSSIVGLITGILIIRRGVCLPELFCTTGVANDLVGAFSGNVTYQDQANATSKGLTFVDGAGHAIVKVDNTTTLLPGPLVNRDSVSILSRCSIVCCNVLMSSRFDWLPWIVMELDLSLSWMPCTFHMAVRCVCVHETMVDAL